MDLYAHAKSVVELQACPIHHKHPHVSYDKGKFEIDCCCSAFKVNCLKVVIAYLLGESESKLSVVWKKPE